MVDKARLAVELFLLRWSPARDHRNHGTAKKEEEPSFRTADPWRRGMTNLTARPQRPPQKKISKVVASCPTDFL